MRPLALDLVAVWTTLLLLAGCSAEDSGKRGESSLAPGSRPDIVATLRGDLTAERHSADGAGRAWIEAGPDTIGAGGSGRWRLVYEAGPEGIAAGGLLFLQVSPFWGWSTTQVRFEEAPGFVELSTDASGVTLDAEPYGEQLLGVRIEGRKLEPGERVTLVYGAGPAGARADRFAEHGSRFWFAVDGNGDGIRALVESSPVVTVGAGPPARVVLTLPSTARVGDTVRLQVAVLDEAGNAGVDFAGELALSASGGLRLPAAVELRQADRGLRRVEAVVLDEGVHRVSAAGPGALSGASNPLVVSARGLRILWGDVHGHSNFSDGTGTPRDYLEYAREVAALDVAALTDHDHWGLQPLARYPENWEEIRRETELFHRPGEFVTLLGYEWTSWLHGHRHVLYFEDRGEVLSSVDPDYQTPSQLWDALRGRPALTFAHHSAGGPIATNWEFPPDPELEPVTEITSVHGSSEAPDSPRSIYSPAAGNFVRDALDRGYRLGFIGSGDSHDGHPGLAHLASENGGLAAILSPELTREGVLAAMKARQVYATNGPRIVLRVTLGGRPMGSSVPPAASTELEIEVVGVEPLERIDIIRSGQVETLTGGTAVATTRRKIENLRRGEYLYVRVVQIDDGAAWSSPFFVE